MSFESLLEGDPQVNYTGPDYHSITALRTQISEMTTKASNNFAIKSRLEFDHSSQVKPQLGYCAHCQSHGVHLSNG